MESSYTVESERLRGELNRLRGVEEQAKNKTNQVTSLLEELEKLKKELSVTQQEKKTIEDWAHNYRDEMEKVRWGSRSISVSYLQMPALILHFNVVTCPSKVCVFFPSVHTGCSFSDVSVDVVAFLSNLEVLKENSFYICIGRKKSS